jgi:hypothetical protein
VNLVGDTVFSTVHFTGMHGCLHSRWVAWRIGRVIGQSILSLDMVQRDCHAAVCALAPAVHLATSAVARSSASTTQSLGIAIRTPTLFLHELYAKSWDPNSNSNNLHATVPSHPFSG